MFKTIILLVSLLSISFVFADAKQDRKQARFEKYKVKILETLNTKISMLEDNKTCIEAATTKETLKNCRVQAKEAKKAHRDKLKSQRAERKAKKEARKKARKAAKKSKQITQ
jgi:hypothetical protein